MPALENRAGFFPSTCAFSPHGRLSRLQLPGPTPFRHAGRPSRRSLRAFPVGEEMRTHHYPGFRVLPGESIPYVALLEEGWGSADRSNGHRDRRPAGALPSGPDACAVSPTTRVSSPPSDLEGADSRLAKALFQPGKPGRPSRRVRRTLRPSLPLGRNVLKGRRFCRPGREPGIPENLVGSPLRGSRDRGQHPGLHDQVQEGGSSRSRSARSQFVLLPGLRRVRSVRRLILCGKIMSFNLND
ncbi:MAG: hypothetical protein D084_Lepto4C00036G0005 [Leptospirillum sp. Group IV 'UBA BS']|nr:MAG: hypothetical protein D084_Lepto4C00036G0005 [Leptospirillum sp. Group IV 'UBA BS']